jgi:hypothetical protein
VEGKMLELGSGVLFSKKRKRLSTLFLQDFSQTPML